MPGSLLGNIVPRVEDPDLVRGHSTFVDNQRIDGTAHAVFVRSPFAHARITAIDTAEAERAPGVLAVYTGASLQETWATGRCPPSPRSTRAPCGRALAVDRVRFVGDPVAMVVAETRAQAVDAAELVDVDYDELPVVADMEAALADGAPLQFEAIGTNIAASRARQATGPTRSPAPTTWSGSGWRTSASPPRRSRATRSSCSPATATGSTVWVSTQQPHMARDLLAGYTGLDQERVRVVAPHVGGAFGGKAGISADHAAVVAAARLLGRPVKWTETRSEAMLSMHGPRPGAVRRARADRATAASPGCGSGSSATAARTPASAARSPLGPTYMMAQGVYDIPEIALRRHRRADQHRAGRRVPRRRAARGGRAARADDRPRRRRARHRARGDPAPQPHPARRVPLHHAAPASPTTSATTTCRCARRCGSPTSRRPARSSGAASTPASAELLGIGIASYVEITGFGGSEFGSGRGPRRRHGHRRWPARRRTARATPRRSR